MVRLGNLICGITPEWKLIKPYLQDLTGSVGAEEEFCVAQPVVLFLMTSKRSCLFQYICPHLAKALQ